MGQADHPVAAGVVDAVPGQAPADEVAPAGRFDHLDAAAQRPRPGHETTGTPNPLGAAADQAAYRILQQALSNAARHGSGNVHIELTYTDAVLALTITNPVPRDGQPGPGGGHGLIGMRERATLLAGTLNAERANGTFRVHASIPYGGHRP
jgi:signal transduction histidine kinase